MVCPGCARRAFGPRRMDPHQQSKIKQSTPKRYKQAIGRFVVWCTGRQSVEYKNDVLLSKSIGENLVAATEFLLPRVKGKLGRARAVVKGRSVQHKAACVSQNSSSFFPGAALCLRDVSCHAVEGHVQAHGRPLLQAMGGSRPGLPSSGGLPAAACGVDSEESDASTSPDNGRRVCFADEVQVVSDRPGGPGSTAAGAARAAARVSHGQGGKVQGRGKASSRSRRRGRQEEDSSNSSRRSR